MTFWMNHAGIALPCESLRCPVSIWWLISTFTSVVSPTRLARMRIGSAMFSPSAAAAAESNLDLFRRHVKLPVGFHQRVDIGGLRHLDPRGQRRIGAGRNVENRRDRIRVLLDQD